MKIKRETQMVPVEFFITSDNKEFDTLKEAENHQEKIDSVEKFIFNDGKWFEGDEPEDMIGSLWISDKGELYILAQIACFTYRMIGLTTANRYKDFDGDVTMADLTKGLTPIHGKYKLKWNGIEE